MKSIRVFRCYKGPTHWNTPVKKSFGTKESFLDNCILEIVSELLHPLLLYESSPFQYFDVLSGFSHVYNLLGTGFYDKNGIQLIGKGHTWDQVRRTPNRVGWRFEWVLFQVEFIWDSLGVAISMRTLLKSVELHRSWTPNRWSYWLLQGS